jgi:hypothetical protein
MTAKVHPSSGELLAALSELESSHPTLEHLEECLACRIRMSRIRHAAGPVSASVNSLQRIVEASTPLPAVLTDIVLGGQHGNPEPNELWRVGRSQALLVWVRGVYEDGVADVVPVVLDVELSDDESIVLGEEATPLATELVAMVSLRTHIRVDAFLNRVGILDITEDVTELMTAAREHRRPTGVRAGPPIDDDDDQRLEYRQALRDLLAELSPSAWEASQEDGNPGAQQKLRPPSTDRSHHEIGDIKIQLGERLWGVQCRDVEPQIVTVDSAVYARSVLKVVYLDTAVLVSTLHGERLEAFPDTKIVAEACRKMTLIETDADAVAVAIPRDSWQTLLFTTAHMRSAFEVPSGAYRGPTPRLEGFGIVDTLCKHLEGVMPAWEVTERTGNLIGATSLHQVAARHASSSIGRITAEGKRALQPAKRTGFASLPGDLDERVAKFIVTVVNRGAVGDALAELNLESRDD